MNVKVIEAKGEKNQFAFFDKETKSSTYNGTNGVHGMLDSVIFKH